MNIYLIYFLIIILNIIFFIIIKDKIKALRLTGILTIISSILLIVLTFIIKTILNSNITFINVSILTNYIFKKFTYTSLILFILGIIEILISKYILSRKITEEDTIV